MLPTVGRPCQAALIEGFDVLPPDLPGGLSCFECHDSSHFSGGIIDIRQAFGNVGTNARLRGFATGGLDASLEHRNHHNPAKEIMLGT